MSLKVAPFQPKKVAWSDRNSQEINEVKLMVKIKH